MQHFLLSKPHCALQNLCFKLAPLLHYPNPDPCQVTQSAFCSLRDGKMHNTKREALFGVSSELPLIILPKVGSEKFLRVAVNARKKGGKEKRANQKDA